MSTMQKVLIGAVVVAVLSGGAAWAAIESSSSSGPGPDRSVLQRPGALGGFPGGSRVDDLRRLGGARLLCRLAHADAVLADGGTTRDVRLDHGVVDAISAESVTIKEADGTVTVPIDAATRVRRDGQQASLSAVLAGDTVFVLRVGGGAAKVLRAFDAGDGRCGMGAPGLLEPSPSA